MRYQLVADSESNSFVEVSPIKILRPRSDEDDPAGDDSDSTGDSQRDEFHGSPR